MKQPIVLKRQVVHRLFLSLYTMLVVAVSFLEPESLSYRTRVGNGISAQLCYLTMFVMAIMAFVDTFINDVLPDKYSFKTGKQFRQYLWLFVGVTFAGLAFVSAHGASAFFLAISYTLHAAWCASVAFLDLSFEFARWGRRVTDRPAGIP